MNLKIVEMGLRYKEVNIPYTGRYIHLVIFHIPVVVCEELEVQSDAFLARRQNGYVPCTTGTGHRSMPIATYGVQLFVADIPHDRDESLRYSVPDELVSEVIVAEQEHGNHVDALLHRLISVALKVVIRSLLLLVEYELGYGVLVVYLLLDLLDKSDPLLEVAFLRHPTYGRTVKRPERHGLAHAIELQLCRNLVSARVDDAVRQGDLVDDVPQDIVVDF